MLRQHLDSRSPIAIYVSPSNPGARAFATELQARYPKISVVDNPHRLPAVPNSWLQIQFDSGACHKYKPHSLHKICREHDPTKTAVEIGSAAVGDRVVHPARAIDVHTRDGRPSGRDSKRAADACLRAPLERATSMARDAFSHAPSLTRDARNVKAMVRASPAGMLALIQRGSSRRVGSVSHFLVSAASLEPSWRLERALLRCHGLVCRRRQLYLNDATFVGSDGALLAEEVRIAMAAKLPIVMVHENDPDKGGVQFDRFFTTTPSDLIQDGIYKKLALACYPGTQDRACSLATVAKVGLGFTAIHRSALPSVLSQICDSSTRKRLSRLAGRLSVRRHTMTVQVTGTARTKSELRA